MKNNIARWSVFGVLLVGFLGVALYAVKQAYIPRDVPKIAKYEPWNDELVELVSSMPVQEGGRLKPFSTWARFRLYAIHSKPKITVKVGEDEDKIVISPTEWMLDCMFRPQVADGLPSFRIENSDIAKALSIPTDTFLDRNGKEVTKKKRDLYSLYELDPGKQDDEKRAFLVKFNELNTQRLESLGEGKVLKGLEGQKLNLVSSVYNYRKQAHFTDLVRFFNSISMNRYDLASDDKNPSLIEELTEELGREPTLEEELESLDLRLKNNIAKIKHSIKGGNDQVKAIFENNDFLELRTTPPTDKEDFTWLSHNTAIQSFMTTKLDMNDADQLTPNKDKIGAFVDWAKLVYVYDAHGEEGLIAALRKYSNSVNAAVVMRGENLDMIKSEVKYYKRNYFAYALGFFLLGVLVMICLLPSPHSLYGKILGYVAVGCSLAGAGWVIAGVIHRGVIMQRYPLGKLYDTILVITSVMVLVLLFMELLSRRKVCLGVAVTFGLIGMFLARRFEVGNGSDTLLPLEAVLNSDYWLITHVTCISIGYAGGLVAAGLSTFYLFARMTGIDNGDKSFQRSMTRLAYGAAAFTLVFALVGTILGGVWANDSWGRFWGWDPKENGALMIVLWFLALLHARLAGYIREWGIHICMVLGANVIAFSWWGVNFLSTGLHNYGFASGGDGEYWLNVYYLLNVSIAILAMGFALADMMMKRQRKLERMQQKENNAKGDSSLASADL